MKNKLIYPRISYLIVGILYQAYNELGFGYLDIKKKSIRKQLKIIYGILE